MGGYCPGGFCPGGILSGGYCPGDIVLIPYIHIYIYIYICWETWLWLGDEIKTLFVAWSPNRH